MRQSKKYFELTDEKKINEAGITLYRIRAVTTFNHKTLGKIKKGEKGGWIEKEENLFNPYSERLECSWVSDNAEVYGKAIVYGNAAVGGNARLYGEAWVFGKAKVYVSAKVHDNADVLGNAVVCDDAEVR